MNKHKQYNSQEGKKWLDIAQAHVLELYNQKQDSRLVYHTYQFTTELVEQVELLAEEEDLSVEQKEISLMAAWFANTGYLLDYQDYAYYSKMEVENFLLANDYPRAYAKQIKQIILDLKNNQTPTSKAGKVLSDAYTFISICQNYEEKSALLRLEWDFMLDRKMSSKEWKLWKLQQLLNTRFYTHFAKSSYQLILSQAVQLQKSQLDKYDLQDSSQNDQGPNTKRRFDTIEKRVPERGIQTFFRSNFRNHINLSAIADNKANIMISVNTILISVLITVLSYRNITETKPMVMLPVVMFLVTGLVSLIFAVLSARPKITSINNKPLPPNEIRKNIVFFGNFVRLDLEAFEKAMDDVFNDSELLYGNMTRDLYHLGKVLDKKYRFLTISYNVFMLGFIATVLTFLVVLLA